jgi:hypothetical protein
VIVNGSYEMCLGACLLDLDSGVSRRYAFFSVVLRFMGLPCLGVMHRSFHPWSVLTGPYTVILDCHPAFTTSIILVGWGVKTAVATCVSGWVGSDPQTSEAWLAYSIP